MPSRGVLLFARRDARAQAGQRRPGPCANEPTTNCWTRPPRRAGSVARGRRRAAHPAARSADTGRRETRSAVSAGDVRAIAMTEPKISLRDVEHVARLARLELSEADKERMRRELDSILSYIDKLRAVDTEGVEPTSHAVPLTNVMREDVTRPSFPQSDMLANAPERSGEFFRVPKIIE